MNSKERERNTIVIANGGELSDEQYADFADKILYTAMDVTTDEDASRFLSDLNKTKCLMAAREYRKWRKKFQVLETECYVIMYEKGYHQELVDLLTPSEYDALEWLCGLKKDERNEVIHRTCRFTSSYKQAMKKEMFEQNTHFNTDRVAQVCDAWMRDRVFEYVSESKTNIASKSLEDALDDDGLTYPASIIHNTVDGTKDKLLRAGALGVGDGVYVSRDDKNDITKALNTRVKNLVDAFRSFLDISDEFADGTAYTIYTSHPRTTKLNDETIVGLALCMMAAQSGIGKVQLMYTNDYYGVNDSKTFGTMMKLFSMACGYVPSGVSDASINKACMCIAHGDELTLVKSDDQTRRVVGECFYGLVSEPIGVTTDDHA